MREAAGIGHNGDSPLDACGKDVVELLQETPGIPAAALARLVQDVHRQLGQPVAGEHVDGATLDHLTRRREAIAEEPAAVRHPQDVHAARVVVPGAGGDTLVAESPVPAELESLWSALGGEAEAWEVSLACALD